MTRIQRLIYGRPIDNKAATGIKRDVANGVATSHGRVTNRQSSKRHETERLIATALICAGVVAFAADSMGGAAFFGTIGVSLYTHSNFLALFSDED